MSKWQDNYYVRVFELAREGYTNDHISQALGVSVHTFNGWVSGNPVLKDVLQRARKDNQGKTRFSDYVYDRLPTHLQELWDKINRCEDLPNGIEKIEALLEKHGKTARQHLFLYALVNSNFNWSDACKAVNIPKKTFEKWCTQDPDFMDMIQEIHWHKQNFFEGALIKGVADGDPGLIKFANISLNGDRGYVDKKITEKTGKIKHVHVHAIATTKQVMQQLDLEGKRKLVEAMRVVRDQKLQGEEQFNGDKVRNASGRELTQPQSGQQLPLLLGSIDKEQGLQDLQSEGRRGTSVGETGEALYSGSSGGDVGPG